MTTNTSAAILNRLLTPKKDVLSPETTRYLLHLDFSRGDHVQMNKLSSKAQEGTLTESERAELEEYLRVADLLALLQSKARRALGRADVPS